MGPVSERTSTSEPVAGDDPAALRRIAEAIVVEAAEHLRGLPRPWDEPDGAALAGARSVTDTGVTTKSTPTDVVTASDHALETLIRSRLAELRPGEAVVGEEQGGRAPGGRLSARLKLAGG